MTEADQRDWEKIYDQCGYRAATLAEIAKIDEGSFRKYLKRERIPRDLNKAKMVKVMKIASQIPRLQFHPSYGYATPEQIERLKSIGSGPEMEYLLKQIEEQTRNKGKFK